MSRRWLSLFFALLCWISISQAIPQTSIQDTLYNADGSPASGLLTISWNGFTAADGTTVAANSITLRIVNGVLKVSLVPNVPGTSYTAVYFLSGKTSSTETWIVPPSALPLRLGQVRAAAVPTAPAGGGSTPNLYTLGGLTGIGPTSFSPSATLEVFDATAGTGATRQILRSGAGQGNTPLLEFHNGSSANAVGFRIPPLSSSTTYTLPAQDGLPGSLLSTDGTGHLGWSAPQSLGGGTFYQTFENSGAALPQRDNANFTNGLQAVDDAAGDRTNVSPVYGNTANTITQGNDPRLSDARTPLAHAATHAAGGSDPVTPGSIGALKNTSDTIQTGASSNIGLIVKGAPGQVASLQEWHDSNDNLLASITSTGRVFFPEAFFSARPGETATSLFYQIDGLNRFSMTTFANAYNFNRYDDSGNYKDTPLQIVRSGNVEINASLDITDPTAGTGTTKVTIKAGAGQGSTNLQEWQNSSGTVLSSVDANGFFQLPAAQKHGSGAQVQLFGGGIPAMNDCAMFDASGNVVSAGGSCGSVHVPVFQDAETPAGTIDGSNAVFTLAAAPNPGGSLELVKNGVMQKAGVDYTVSGNTITFTSGAIPQAGDALLAWYRMGTSAPSSAAGGDLSGNYPNPTVAQVGGVTAANIASGANAANAAVSANTAGTIVKRDSAGNFSAGTITAALNGNANTATALAAAPVQCGASQFSTGVAANGNANCSGISAAALPNLNTANQGYFFGVTITAPTSDGATAALTANQMKVYQFVLPFGITVNNLTFEVTSASGTCSGICHANLGLYDAACGNLLAQTGVMTSGGTPNINAAGTYTVSIQNGSGATGNVTLAPGVYWLAYTSDSSSLLLRAAALTSHAMNFLTNQNAKLAAVAGNAGSAGVFPASCGALTTATTSVPPMVLFQR